MLGVTNYYASTVAAEMLPHPTTHSRSEAFICEHAMFGCGHRSPHGAIPKAPASSSYDRRRAAGSWTIVITITSSAFAS